ncbi:OLC1v1008763C1 [Oldenlandia corymbosa var. corymbosa]|uniref:RING-type E3 ubiquitin transferase n=1 Tax=Oldenlandia corymbosa var. corymbosa TaxID=529605 RepID=A0AAV1DMB2_OLDCO|nr:OLC1v1008763C1 [Oldenlandia corymbosa var. corymbosa]
MAAIITSTSTSSSSSSALLIQEIFIHFHSRKLLLHSPLLQSPVGSSSSPSSSSISPSSSPSEPVDNSFDANVVMVLSVLLCALICSLGLNSIIRCALRCSTLVSTDQSNQHPSARLANTGIKKKALKKFTTIGYNTSDHQQKIDTECAICLSEFTQGERVRILPKCGHGFHVRCIDKWLNSHSSCPTCRHCLIETCQKIAGCSSQDNSFQHQPSTSSIMQRPQQETIVRVAVVPLEREGCVRNFEA